MKSRHALALLLAALLGGCASLGGVWPVYSVWSPKVMPRIEAGELSVSQVDRQGNTALIMASGAGDLESVQRLLALGADPFVANRYGETPLYLALQNGHRAVAELLLKAAP